MNVLHICNDYTGSKVHSNLAKCLDELKLIQNIYCPVRTKEEIGKNQFDGRYISFAFDYCIKPWYKYVFHYKALRLYKSMKSKLPISDSDVIHAHTLFSDGVLALKAHKEYGTRYCIAVRNTDMNIYIRLMKHTYSTGREIVLNAERVYFISAGIKKQFEESAFIRPILDKVKEKFVLQPNGIDDYWHQHISHEQRTGHDVLYIGDFSANKNVVRLAEAVLELRKETGFEDVRLIIVGGEVKGGARKNDGKTQAMIDANPDAIKALGKIYDKDKLSEVMRSCSMFAMTSIFETFGLVYIEALSQNLPVVFTKGQGIDGMFDKSVGIAVDPLNVGETKEAIKTILTNHKQYGNMNVNFEEFDWKQIAKHYLKDYEYHTK